MIIINFKKWKIKEVVVANIPSCKLADGRMPIKKSKIYNIYDIVSLGMLAGKTEPFFMKVSWIWTCSQIFRKF